MSYQNDHPRILAIDLRMKRFGYAVFDGPQRLLDWGGRGYLSGAVAGRRVADLLDLFHPSMVVIRKERRTGVRNRAGVAALMKSIRREATTQLIVVRLINPEEIKEAFRIFGVRTKEEIASMLAGIFPELLWNLPPKRKAWETERHVMAVFDAIAVGFTYWYCNGTPVSPPEQQERHQNS